MSSGDFVPALEEFFGSAVGLSASVITRLTTDWQHERDQFAHRSLKDVDYVYVYVDGIHFNVRLEEARLCALVIVGVRLTARGARRPRRSAIASRRTRGQTCSADSSAHEHAPSGARRRRRRARLRRCAFARSSPTRHQRCWLHKMANVLDALPKSLSRPRGKRSKRSATPRARITPRRPPRHSKDSEFRSGRRRPMNLSEDLEQLLPFYDFPAEHWMHLKTTNAIRVDLRRCGSATTANKGPGSRASGNRHGLQADE